MTETITTPEALDALPDQDVLLLASGRYPDGGNFIDCWVRPLPAWISGGDERVWEVLVYGAALRYTAVLTEHVDLPVTVLFCPDAPTPTPAEVRREYHTDECPFGCPHFDEPAPASDGLAASATKGQMWAALEEVWDDGNAIGLDGWIGPGRGAGDVDDHAVFARERVIRKVLARLGIEVSR